MNYTDILNRLRADAPLTKDELEALLSWLLSEEGKQSVEQGIWQEWQAFETSETYDYRQLLDRIHQKIDERTAHRVRPFGKYVRYVMEAAAAVVLVAGATLYLNTRIERRYRQYAGSQQREQVEIYNPKGLRTTVTLPDGSTVTLNADSKIAYVKDFLPHERNVQLWGEAFFEVAKEASRPFTVQAGTARMTVLGTSFNVRSYPESEYIETTLVEGSLRVGAGESEYTLTPGNRSRIHKASQAASVQAANIAGATGWMNGRLYFEGTPCREMVAVLERAFSINIRVEHDALLQKQFTGKFEHGESIEQIVEVLALSVAATGTFDKATNTVVIR